MIVFPMDETKFTYHPLDNTGFIIILLTLVLFFLFIEYSSASADFEEIYWSEDVQLTHGEDANYKYLLKPTIQENTDGSLQMLYAKQADGATFQLANMNTDKLGRSPTHVSNSTEFPKWDYRHHTHVTYKGIYYDEATDTIRFISPEHGFEMYLWFTVFDSHFNILNERRFHVGDLFDDATNFRFSRTMDVYWDAQGVAHIAGTLSKKNDDDLWMFVDGKLAMDLGGLHIAVDGEVNLDDLGLEPNKTYTMDIFHAERHTFDSNFRITTSIRPTSD